MPSSFPKIELHVHLEGAVRPADLLRIARRNGVSLPADDEAGLSELYRFRDFEHFIELWIMTTHAIRTAEDFRDIVVGYAREAASHGAVYVEGIFTPAERVMGGASWDEVFTGFTDGAALAEEETGVVVRLTPDIPRGFPLDTAVETARYAVKYRDRGVVGIGLGGLEAQHPPEPYAPAFDIGRDGGLGSVPHAGEVVGAESIRGALDALGANRLRHGIRAVEDPALLQDLADRQIVCDVCPISNVRTRAVPSIDAHPLPTMVAAGVPCSISTDDPAMFETDLTAEHDAAQRLGLTPEAAYAAGMLGALCDEPMRARLAEIGRAWSWTG
ncbi:MAG: adenosine deaminase [Acidimicrobiia bacterium]